MNSPPALRRHPLSFAKALFAFTVDLEHMFVYNECINMCLEGIDIDQMSISEIIQAFRGLSLEQRHQLLQTLQEQNWPAFWPTTGEIREDRFRNGVFCPYCNGGQVRKNGKFAGRQRYHCRPCNRTFNDFTGTPMHRTRLAGKWPDYLECMVLGYSLRKCAELLDIHLSTTFDWRHKVLHALTQAPGVLFHGIVEVDETYELFSAKGSRSLGRKPRRRGGKASKPGVSDEQACVVTARDRAKTALGSTAGLGRLDSKALNRILEGRLADDAILVSDGGTAFPTFCWDLKLRHKAVNASKGLRVEGIYHIQNVNSMHKRFKDWSNRFNGVATKYLDNYWAWFEYLDHTKSVNLTDRINRLLLEAVAGLMRADGESMPEYYDARFAAMCA